VVSIWLVLKLFNVRKLSAQISGHFDVNIVYAESRPSYFFFVLKKKKKVPSYFSFLSG